MLSALEKAKRNGATIVAVNPLPEAGLMRFKNPQKPRGVVGRGTALADQFLQIRLGGDLALFQAIEQARCSERGRGSTTRSSTRLHRRASTSATARRWPTSTD